MKNLTHLILESVDILIKEDAPSIFEVLFSNKYLSLYKGMPNLFFPKIKPWLSKNEKQLKSLKHKVNSTLYNLKKQGLIERGVKQGKWEITEAGIKKLEFLKLKFINKLFLPKIKFPIKKSGDKIIFIFDIPEKERHKRDWVRQQLRLLEFSQLQKSVWVGHNKVPQQLIEAFGVMNILDNIHIFRIKDSGTMAI